LARLEVYGLLNRFDHVISIPNDWEFVILHGPNGVGKTKLLEIIDASFSGNVERLERIPFHHCELSFDDGTRMVLIQQNTRPTQNRDSRPRRWANRVKSSVTITVYLPGDAPPLTRSSSPRVAKRYERYLDALEDLHPVIRVGPDRFQDTESGESYTSNEALLRYELINPESFQDDEEEPELREFFSSLSVHMIDTQRLLTDHLTESQRQRLDTPIPSRVSHYARDLVRRLGHALAANSRTSQQLDRTFPQRLMTNKFQPKSVTEEQIRTRYAEQSELRNRLAGIAVLDNSPDFELPNRELQDWERRVLWTYLEDVQDKLATFDLLLNKLELLRDIINARFLFKQLKIDRERGFLFITDTGHELGPDRLSSGEQHELVLLYDLLFNVKPNSLVLIDEPEISLHVSWQQQFLNDVIRISEITSLRFVIATHSPQIIHKWWSRTQALAADPEEA